MAAFTESQKHRLLELGACGADISQEFESFEHREKQYKLMEKELVRESKKQILDLLSDGFQVKLLKIQSDLSAALMNEKFTQVATPSIITKAQLEKMTIGEDHPLSAQVFWLDKSRCLRPMLAPNLYEVSRDLLRFCEKPLRIFEIGSCFRKESSGNSHLNEFTMCNLVEWGLREEDRDERIRYLSSVVMSAAGISGYEYEKTVSEVYGDTVDVVKDGTELASGNLGPHFLDAAFGIDTTWVGLGFGVERLLMTKEGSNNIHSVGKSLSYLNGYRLNIK